MEHVLRLITSIEDLHRVWDQTPFVSRDLGYFDDIFGLESAERLLDGGLPLSSVRLLRDGATLPTSGFAGPGGVGSRMYNIADVGKVNRAVAGGATLLLEELDRHSTSVGAFAAAVGQELGAVPYSAAFLTPPHSRGADAHYDLVNVFIRQVSGSKRWRVRPPVKQWPTTVRPVDQDATDTLIDTVLHEGDCLFIPRGYIHVGDATDEPSVHLSLGLTPTTWADVYERMLQRAVSTNASFREALPLGLDLKAREAALSARMSTLLLTLGRQADSGLAALYLAPANPSVPVTGGLVAALKTGESSGVRSTPVGQPE